MIELPHFSFKLHTSLFKLSVRKIVTGIYIVGFCLGIFLSIFLLQAKHAAEEQAQLATQAYEDLNLDYQKLTQEYGTTNLDNQDLLEQYLQLQEQVATLSAELNEYLIRDEFLINQELEKEISEINSTYKLAVATYDRLAEAKDEGVTKDQLEKEFTKALIDLAERQYQAAEDKLTFVKQETEKELAALVRVRTQQLASEQVNQQENISNTPPLSGFSRQRVSSPVGTFTVDIVAADLSTTRVLVDTAADGDCGNECPTLSVADYATRNGAYAAINGSYFCPASYASCVGKSNSFDTLLMNKDKKYFNSDNNVYSTVPAVIFGSGWVRFVTQSLEWGRDTSIDSMIANQPLLVSGGSVVFGGDGDPKKGSKSNRSFVASRANSNVYIGIVWNATVAEAAQVLSSLGMDYALNLDAGGSTALWYGGYKAGPGRSVPNAILFVNK